MTDQEFQAKFEAILDAWPYVRSRLSEIISSRSLEEIDDIIGGVEDLVAWYLEEKRKEF